MNIMTLSIAKRVNKNDYQIIGLNVDNQDIVSLVGITKDNIMSNDDIRWDIGATTFVEGLNKINNTDKVYTVSGVGKLLHPFNREDFVDKLKMQSLGTSNFFVNAKEWFDIVKIVRLEDIFYRNNTHYIRVILKAKSNHKDKVINESGIMQAGGDCIIEELPIIDIRWVNYWNWAIKTGVYEEKRIVYRKQFNKSYHEKYAILFRDKYGDFWSPKYYITGLHLL